MIGHPELLAFLISREISKIVEDNKLNFNVT